MRPDLSTLIAQMESASPTCQCSIEAIRGTDRISLWWVDEAKSYFFECGNARANLGNSKFVHALKSATEAMR